VRSFGEPTGSGLVQELLRNHRRMLQVLGFLLVLAVSTAGVMLLVAQPRLERSIEMAYAARNVQISMLDQSAAVRGWLATGDDEFLKTYRDAGTAGDDALTELVDGVTGDATPGLTDGVVETAVARTAWAAWAESVLTRDAGDRDDQQEVETLLLSGRELFETYRDISTRSTAVILRERGEALSLMRTGLLAGCGIFIAVLVATAVAALRARRRVTDEVVAPINHLLHTIDQLRDGDLTARSRGSGVRELDAIGTALDGLASSLGEAQAEAVARETRLAQLAARFETVVQVGREIAGSLSVRYVSSAVTSASAELLGAPTTLWVRGEDQVFHASARSVDPHGVLPSADLTPSEVVAAAAADARTAVQEGSCAYPLVLAGMVVGVLETSTTDVDQDTHQVLQALLATAAAALESAHLHSAAKELADVDALTRLPNRRRFEHDIDQEWERCRRYGRPMSLVMLDLDHFKTLNDQHGHLFGDQVLRGAADALGGVLRTSDTAYRYGGEEFAILLRETGLEDAAAVGERLRTAVAEFTIPGQGVLVTASAGVAERASAMSHYTELIAKADAVLYDAKAAGRDRVVAAGLGPG
jgi:diguanylate cyclase (GGDEF)-like protein